MGAICPVNIYGLVNADWVFKLRRLVSMGDRVELPEYTLSKTTRNKNPNDGFCYLFKGGIEVRDLCDVGSLEIPAVSYLHIKSVISSFTFVRQNRPTRYLTFIPGAVVCDSSNPDWDMITVKAHDTFGETEDLAMFNRTIENSFPEFCLGYPFYPRVDLMAVKKGEGGWYADALNAVATWRAHTFSYLYIEMGKDLYTEDIQ